MSPVTQRAVPKSTSIHSLEDALGVFHTTGLDALVVGDYLIEKPPASGAS